MIAIELIPCGALPHNNVNQHDQMGALRLGHDKKRLGGDRRRGQEHAMASLETNTV